jgi:hypothetical protein
MNLGVLASHKGTTLHNLFDTVACARLVEILDLLESTVRLA